MILLLVGKNSLIRCSPCLVWLVVLVYSSWEISNWEIVAVLEELRESWENLVTLVERLNRLSCSEDPLRMELLVLQEAGLSLKFHAVGFMYTIGYY